VSTTGSVVMGVVSVILLGVVVGGALGYRPLVIKSGSMSPTIDVGAVVVSDTVKPLQVTPGSIVTFRDPALSQQLVTHRVVSAQRVGNVVRFVTKGDANHATERWSVPVSGTVGREVVAIPGVGRVLAVISLPIGRTIEIVGATLIFAFFLLRWIWFRPTAPSVRRRLTDGDLAPRHPTPA
jgi:signal peptidase